ncbi:MAG: hypothetical protein P4L99_02610 [Chthoniobacter sp.]|nr:hypothetical protein [Chthoniobacter sp.]
MTPSPDTASGSPAPSSDGRFAHQSYTIKRPALSFLGRKYYVYAPDGTQVMFLKHPMMKLKEEFTIYTDETESAPLLTVRSRSFVALNMAHDVIDPQTGERTGSIRSRGMKSLVRDTWDILDANDEVVGLMEEEGAALLRRVLKFLPGKHKIELNGQRVASLDQKFRFFGKEVALDLTPGAGQLDARFAVGCALLALIKESEREKE